MTKASTKKARVRPTVEETRAKEARAARLRSLAKRRLLRLHTSHLLAIAGIALVVGILWRSSIDVDRLMTPFFFQNVGEPPLLLLRCGVLFFSLYALRKNPMRALVLVGLFVLSLIARGAFFVFVVAAIGLSVNRLVTNRSVNFVLSGSVVFALALVVLPLLRTPPVLPDGSDPAKMVEYWRGRKNLYQARFWAVAWAKSESRAPGNGLLALAKLDWDLGRQASAMKMITRLCEHPGSDAAREAGEAQRATWQSAMDKEPHSETAPPMTSSDPRSP